MKLATSKGLTLILLLCGWLFCGTALALTVDQAKQQGRVGETLSGYLAAVQQDGETQALVTRINQAREQQYQQVAKNNQVSTADVARLAGQKLVARAGKGEFVRGINGQWLQK
ncbi:MAG: YdbL family protein [Rouxiella aceris]|uniref:YdbL family protein n=1 Tax=Rouxiella aceris TaxID=2703884 RepID=UPI00283DA64D|nr:YdbL family protein [Rouxiella aceris]MDR3434744.1 YdbL family protein [Rouxiella aceris]